MTSERSEMEALAAKVGVYYHDGRVSLGAPLYAFTPDELHEFAQRLQPARVPEGCLDREYVERIHAKSRNWQGQISVNASALADLCRAYLAAAPSPEGEESAPLDCSMSPTGADAFAYMAAAMKPESAPQAQGETIYQYQTVTNGWHDLRDATDANAYRSQGWPVRTLYTHPVPAADALVFADTDPEAGFIADAQRLNCPACGGSGHVGDVITSGDGGVEAMAESICAIIEHHHPEFSDYMPCARDIAARLQPVPEGWKLMPKTITPEMHAACLSVVDLTQRDPEDHRYDDGFATAQALWSAMCDATPPASAPEVTEVTEEMVERAARRICIANGEDPDAVYLRPPMLDRPILNWHRWKATVFVALTAALQEGKTND